MSISTLHLKCDFFSFKIVNFLQMRIVLLRIKLNETFVVIMAFSVTCTCVLSKKQRSAIMFSEIFIV